MSPQADYLQGVGTLLDQAPFDPVKDVLRARLAGQTDTVHGLHSPPLAREEPDALALLIHLYDRIDEHGDQAGLERLRRAAAELAMEAFSEHRPLDNLTLTARLAGAYEVRDTPSQADRLRAFLWGYLDNDLGKDREQVIQLEGDALQRALRVVDLWLAVTPPHPLDWPKHYAEKLIRIYDASKGYLDGPTVLDDARHGLMLLLYRALLKTCPRAAGLRYPGLVDITEKAVDFCDHCAGDFLSLCWEYGILLSESHRWRQALLGGLDHALSRDQKYRYMKRPDDDPFWRGLAKLDHIDRDLRARWPRHDEPETARFGQIRPLPTPKRAA